MADSPQRFTTQKGKPPIPGLPFWVVLDHAERVAHVVASQDMAASTIYHLTRLPVGVNTDYSGSRRLYHGLTREDTTP